MANDTPEPPGFHDPDAYQALWDAMSWQERLKMITGTFPAPSWFGVEAIPSLTLARMHGHPGLWGETKATFKAIGGNPFDLEKEVDKAVRLYQRSLGEATGSPAAAPSELPPRRSVPAAGGSPPLPVSAQCQTPTAHAAPWLEAYVAHSQRWSPRGIAGAHQAVGLWILSTVAARRIFCQVGSSRVSPVLCLAMVARSTLYAKSTTAALGRDMLTRAGCKFLLTADRTTPQALIRSMAGLVPATYGQLPADRQEDIRRQLAFAGQRGAYFEEWGGMLHQMRRTDSPMAEFHTLLRVLDDNQPEYSNATIQRGLEAIQHPYLALLASATPHDLAPFMTEGSAWWHDGFWPRFAFIAPQPDEHPSLAQRPRTGYQVPSALILPLHAWHTRLGMPAVTVTPRGDAQGKPTDLWDATVGPLPQHELQVSEAVYDAYERYNVGLLTLLHSGEVSEDFDASYGRLHEKALRIALLLAGMNGDPTIGIHHWSYAQTIVEGWRRNLHDLTRRIGEAHPLSLEEQAEQKILAYLERAGQATARELQRACHLQDSSRLKTLLAGMLAVGHLLEERQGRKTLYGLLPSDTHEETQLEENNH